MNSLKQTFLLCLSLILMVGSGWYFANTSSAPLVQIDKHALSMMEDAIVTDLNLHQFDASGRLMHYLRTPLARHIPLNNTHHLQTPHIVVIQDDQSPWNIHAEKAVALYGGKEVTLSQNVVIHQDKNEKAQATTLKTEEITYLPEKKLAKTLKDVLFTQAGNQVQSTGMNAYLAEDRVHLLHNTRGVYESSHAYADTLHYYVKKHRVELIGHARVEKGKDSFQAPYIVYDTEKQRVLSKQVKNERTTIVIHPEKNT